MSVFPCGPQEGTQKEINAAIQVASISINRTISPSPCTWNLLSSRVLVHNSNARREAEARGLENLNIPPWSLRACDQVHASHAPPS
jgi:hypothetical protein